MKNKIIFAVMFGLILIGLMNFTQASTASLPQPVKQYSCLNLTQICDNCTWVNVTSIQYPNNEKIILNQKMEKNGTEYTSGFCNTTALGTYLYNTLGDPNGLNSIQSVSFKVTSTGIDSNLRTQLFLVLCSVGLFLIGLLIKSKPVGFLSGIFFLITGMYLMIYGLGDVADLYTRTIAIICLSFGMLVTLTAAFEWLSDFED